MDFHVTRKYAAGLLAQVHVEQGHEIAGDHVVRLAPAGHRDHVPVDVLATPVSGPLQREVLIRRKPVFGK